MATLAQVQTGNYTSATTWGLIEPNSFSNAKNQAKTTSSSFVSSVAFTPGPVTIDSIGLYIANRIVGAGGTVSVRLFNTVLAAAVAGTTVTINVSDLDLTLPVSGMGWYSFKFAAPVLLLVGTTYAVQVVSSVSSAISVWTSATTNDWSRFLRTTTNQAPAAGDLTLMQGDWTAAATQAQYVMTNDVTSLATSYGAWEVSKGATHYQARAASTNYNFNCAGDSQIWASGIYDSGTLADPIPATSTFIYQMNSASAVQYGITQNHLSIWRGYTPPLAVDRAMLAADAAAAATALTTNVSTGWKNGDTIALASTTRTFSDSESKAMGADASGTSIPTIAALTSAHSGTGATAGELINLTRRVKFQGASITNTGYINILGSATTDLTGFEFLNLGSSTASKRGIDVATVSTGSFSFKSCSYHDFATATTSLGINMNAAGNSNITIDSNVSYAIQSNHIINLAGVTGLNVSITNHTGIKTGTSGIYQINNCKITFTGNTGAGSASNGFAFVDLTYDGTGVFNNLISHSHAAAGFSLTTLTNFFNTMTTFSNWTSWRNTTLGLNFSSVGGIAFDTGVFFGNGTANIGIGNTLTSTTFNNITSTAGTTQTCPVGFVITTNAPPVGVIFYNSSFGPHSSADISVSGIAYSDALFSNCTFNSTTLVLNQSNMATLSQLKFQRINGTAGNHKTVKHFGVIIPDATIFNVATPSTRMTPNSATYKLLSSNIKLTMQVSQTALITGFWRKSVVGDGTAYNGNQIRLVLRYAPAYGYTETVLVSSTNAANGAFEAFSVTVPSPTDNAITELYLDCDGTTGWINFDDIKVVTNTANDQSSQKYWDNGIPGENLFSKTAGAMIAGGLIV